jgi:hypothetical protein
MFDMQQPTAFLGQIHKDECMSKKLGSWMILMGALVAVLGLCVLPAALRGGADKSLLPAGFAIFSVGILLVAGGLYSKSLALQGPGSAAVAEAPSKVRAGCDRCHTELPAVQCKVHQVHLCDTCLESHYDFRSCVYVPTTRRINAKAVKSMAARSR